MNAARGSKARGGGRRKTFAASATSSQQSNSDAGDNNTPVGSPLLPTAARTPQTAPAGRRVAKPALSVTTAASFSGFTTSPTLANMSPRAVPTKKRSRTTDSLDGRSDDTANNKGGHSLRKRRRVDYSQEHIDDEAGNPLKLSAAMYTRGRKRRSDADDEVEDFSSTPKRRATDSVQFDMPGRRKNPARRTAAGIRSYVELAGGESDINENDVKDTIVFGGAAEHGTAGGDAEDVDEGAAEGDNISEFHGSATDGESSAQELLPERFVIECPVPGETEVAEANGAAVPAATPAGTAQVAPIPLPENQIAVEKEDASREDDRPLRTDAEFAQAEKPMVQGPAATVSTPPAVDGALISEPFAEDTSKIPDAGAGSPPRSPMQEELLASTSQDASQSPLRTMVANQMTVDDCEPAALAAPAAPAALAAPAAPAALAALASSNVASIEKTEVSDAEPTLLAPPASVPPTAAPTTIITKQESNEAVTAPSAVAAEPKPPSKPWSHLTAYVEGEYTYHPESRSRSTQNASGEGTDTPPLAIPEIITELAHDDSQEAEAQDGQQDENEAEEPLEFGVATPQLYRSAAATPVPGSAVPSEPGSPAPLDENDEEQDIEDADDNDDSPDVQHKPKQFPKLRDAEEFREVLQNYKYLSDEDLYDLCAHVDDILVTMQEEYLKNVMMVDDHENVERRRQYDEQIELLEKRLDKPAVPKDFLLKGYSAKMSQDDKDHAYIKRQDRIQAAAYGFKYDPHPAKLGKQDPMAQRSARDLDDNGEPRRSLRSDPARTHKAAEAADEGVAAPAIVGKRIRKPRERFDAVGAGLSRSATPVPRKIGRGRKADDEDAQSGEGGAMAFQVGAAAVAAASKPRGGPGRGRKRAVTPDESHEISAPTRAVEGAEDEGESEGKPRKRRRNKALIFADDFADPAAQAFANAASAAPAPSPSQEADDDDTMPKRNKRIVTLKTKVLHTLSNSPSVAASPDVTDRPSSSSSNASADSNYSFRPKRQRKFTNNDEEQDGPAPRRKKRGPPKKTSLAGINAGAGAGRPNALVGMSSHHIAIQPTLSTNRHNGGKRDMFVPYQGPNPTPLAPAPKTQVKIKLITNNGPLAADPSMPTSADRYSIKKDGGGGSGGGGTGTGDDEEKDYSKMTKSEKMSHSMKSELIPLGA